MDASIVAAGTLRALVGRTPAVINRHLLRHVFRAAALAIVLTLALSVEYTDAAPVSPVPGATAAKPSSQENCLNSATHPTICTLKRYSDNPSLLFVFGAGFTPNSRAVLTLTTQLVGTKTYTNTVRTGYGGRIVAFVYGYCQPASATVFASDVTTGRTTMTQHPPACSSLAFSGSDPMTLDQLTAMLRRPVPVVCDLEAIQPNVCHTGFDGDADSSGSLIIDGTGYQPNERVHIVETQPDNSVIAFDGTADEVGLLDVSSPQKVSCSTLDATVDVTDAAAHTHVHANVPALCFYEQAAFSGTQSDGGSSSWLFGIVPIGVIGSLFAIVRRRSAGAARGSRQETLRMHVRLIDDEVSLYTGPDDGSPLLSTLHAGQDLWVISPRDLESTMLLVQLPNGVTGYILMYARLFTCVGIRLLDEANAYESPNAGAPVIHRFDSGSLLTVVGEDEQADGTWLIVRDDQFGQACLPPNTATSRLGEAFAGASSAQDVQRQYRARRDMFVGGVWCIGGTVVTVATYETASGGGTYVVAWGAILFGGIQFMRGLINSMGDSD